MTETVGIARIIQIITDNQRNRQQPCKVDSSCTLPFTVTVDIILIMQIMNGASKQECKLDSFCCDRDRGCNSYYTGNQRSKETIVKTQQFLLFTFHCDRPWV